MPHWVGTPVGLGRRAVARDDAGSEIQREKPVNQPGSHQQRVIDEKRELDERLTKLDAFILDNPLWQTLGSDEQQRLQRQSNFMALYSQVLDERIAAFGGLLKLPVVDHGPDSMEREIWAKASNGPRVTPDDIEVEIASEHYFTAKQGAFAAFDPPRGGDVVPPELSLLTFCVLVLKNGYTVTGESACVSPENFDAALGRKIARQNAVSKVWPLLGFALKQRLHEGRP